MYTVDPSTRETEAGRSLEFDRGQPGLQRKFLDSQGYTEKPCLEKKKNKNQTNQTEKMEMLSMAVHSYNPAFGNGSRRITNSKL